eukprot:COSAG01_NODE_233_length_20982_cov_14.774458_6_plen_110_part_00
MYYSANVYADRAIQKINRTAPHTPLYIHLTWQNVHGPYTATPEWESLGRAAPELANYCGPVQPGASFVDANRCRFGSMLKDLDDGMGNITDALKETDRWVNTLMIVPHP